MAFSPVYKYDLPVGHRFPMVKYELLPEQLIREGTLESENFFHPPILEDDSILLTHEAGYLQKLNDLTLTRKEERNIGFPVNAALITRGKHIANGTFLCAKHALKKGISMNIAGGTHHAFANRGEGFCVFNDIAIATRMLISQEILSKVLIVDLDVHQGNGTASIFNYEKSVFTFSMHGERNYPLRKEPSDLDIGLPDGASDRLYMQSLIESLPKLIDEFEPEFIFYLAGVDILSSDKLGRLDVSRKACRQRDEYVLSTCKRNEIPVAVVMGGGYSSKLSEIIEAHANTFRVAQEMYF